MTETYEIPAQNWPQLERRIRALARKQAKLASRGPLADTTPIGVERLDTVIKPSEDGGADQVYYQCRVTGAAPRLDGWTFLATLQHEDAGTILRTVPTADVAEGELDRFRDVAPHCEHCGTRRQRKDTFVVRSNDGQVRQVGRSCLSAYLGGASPAAVAALAELLLEAAALCAEAGECGWSWDGTLCAERTQFLACTAASVRLYGWVSRSSAQDRPAVATADHVLDMLFPSSPKMREAAAEFRTQLNDADAKLAQAVLERASAELVPDRGLSDYEHNLRVALADELVSARSAGIAASAVAWHLRRLGKELEAESANAEDVPVGKGVEIRGAIVSLKTVENDYGATEKMTVLDDRGFKVWGSLPKALSDCTVGDRVRFVANVERSRDDAKFGFAKRPRKCERLGAVAKQSQV